MLIINNLITGDTMKLMNMILAAVEACLWYGALYYFLYSIKNDVNLYLSALILLILVYGAGMSCPWFRNTAAWAKMWQD